MAKAAESNDSNKKTVPNILRLISVSEPVFSMVFPMNSWAGFPLEWDYLIVKNSREMIYKIGNFTKSITCC